MYGLQIFTGDLSPKTLRFISRTLSVSDGNLNEKSGCPIKTLGPQWDTEVFNKNLEVSVKKMVSDDSVKIWRDFLQTPVKI